MPPTTDHNQATASSFLGLQSYTEAQSGLFFGRDAETNALTSLVELNTLTIVFGRSGTGKTSLLNAGVFPKLRKSFCLPFRIRLEFNDNSPDLVTQIKKVLKEEIDKYGFKVESYPSSETLWEYFHKEPLWKTVTPIIVFDQFEEIFTLAKANPRFASVELPLFWEELSNLIENNIPEKLKEKFLNQKEKIEFNYKKQKAKIVFSFREEYLPEFETIAAKIPSIKYSRFRLLPMNGYQAYEVITKTWKENIKPSEAKKIVTYLTNSPDNQSFDLLTVEPSLLSQVCTFIDKERIETGGGKVSAELLNKYPKETILRSIYDETIVAGKNALPATGEKEATTKRNPLKEFVEEKLITTDGYRLKYHLTEQDLSLRPGINVLVGKYFLREDDDAVELTHDAVTPIIKSDREIRRNEIAMIEERRKAKEKQKKYIRYAFAIAGLIFAVFLILSLLANNRRLKEERLRERAYAERTMAEADVNKLSGIIKGLRLDSTRLADNNKAKIIYKDSCTSKHFRDSIYQKITIDSMYFTGRVAYLESVIIILRDSLSKKNTQIVTLKDTLKEYRVMILTKEKSYKELLEKFNDLKTRYDSLLTVIKHLRAELADCIKNCQFPAPPAKPIDTSNILKLQLKYSIAEGYYHSLLPDKLKVYLIPITTANKPLVKAASTYDSIEEYELENAEGSIKGIYKAPYFIFPNLKINQKYLIKISTLYGNYHIYERKKNGTDILELDAVPAVKTKHR
jgi:Novel STAND NTPase 1